MIQDPYVFNTQPYFNVDSSIPGLRYTQSEPALSLGLMNLADHDKLIIESGSKLRYHCTPDGHYLTNNDIK